MRELFEERGWDTMVLTSAEDVRRWLLAPEATRPDVVILDLHLVERDTGLDVLQSLKEQAHTRAIPVILCSGDVWALQSLAEPIRSYVAAVLVKPFDIDQAYECVEFVLGGGVTEAETASDVTTRM